LDALGVLERIRDVCWLSEYRTFKNDRDETIRKSLIANESLYGYKNHRVWRRVLLDALLAMVDEQGVKITWEARFEGVVREGNDIDNSDVEFKVNGESHFAGMLIGADGIYSTVRKYLDGDVGPEYTGIVGVLSHIRWDEVEWPYEDHERACTIQGKPGALVLMPEDRQGSVIMVAKQVRMEQQTREQWDEYARHDRDKMCQLFREGYEDWPPGSTARAIIDAVCGRNKDSMYLWPYMRMARLERWYSKQQQGRVVILGDAAHALPPSSGQGVNQALEDVDSLTKLLLNDHASNEERKDALAGWQQTRQDRIDAIFDWATNATNVQRLPQADRDRLVEEGQAKDANVTENFDDMRWLYAPSGHQ
jgi:2-polyprenyl-6-methoxyphenol hydroxylase-like FAD-dependent oxidoreductase